MSPFPISTVTAVTTDQFIAITLERRTYEYQTYHYRRYIQCLVVGTADDHRPRGPTSQTCERGRPTTCRIRSRALAVAEKLGPLGDAFRGGGVPRACSRAR